MAGPRVRGPRGPVEGGLHPCLPRTLLLLRGPWVLSGEPEGFRWMVPTLEHAGDPPTARTLRVSSLRPVSLVLLLLSRSEA